MGQNAVREALIALAQQQFVERFASRAPWVTRLNLAEARQLRVAPAAPEGAAGAIETDGLDIARDARRGAAGNLDRDPIFEFDMEFLRELWRLTGNSCLE